MKSSTKPMKKYIFFEVKEYYGKKWIEMQESLSWVLAF